MAIRGEQDSFYSGVTEIGTTSEVVRKGKGNTVKLPHINGVEVKASDPDGTVAYLRQLDDLRKNGGAPHRGRERRGSGSTDHYHSVRHVSRRGNWKS